MEILSPTPDMEALEPKMAEAAQLMSMLAHPVRLRLLCLLSAGERSVLDLAETAQLSQPATSHHLKKLRDAGIVATRRDAQTIYYSIAGREASAILETLHELYCADVDRDKKISSSQQDALA